MFAKTVNKLINLQKNDILAKAISFYLEGNYSEAEDYLLTSYPENAFNLDSPALTVMGHIQMKLEQNESAKEYFRQALKVAKNDAYFIYDSLGMTYYLNGDNITAIQHFEDAKNSSKNSPSILYHMALCHETILINKIEEHMENLRNSDSSDKEKTKDKDKSLAEIKQLREKIKDEYSEIITNDPKFYNALLNCGTLDANEGLFSAAENYYTKAIAINDKDWKVQLNMGYIKMIEKEYQTSLEFFEKAFELLGKTEEIRILAPYMFILYKNEKWKKLEKICKQVLKIDKKNKQALVYLITSLKKEKKYAQVINLLKKLKKKLKQVQADNDIDEKDTTNQLSLHYTKVKKKIKQDLKELKKVLQNLESEDLNPENENKKLSEYNNQIAKLDMDNINSFGFNEFEITNTLKIYKDDPNNVEALYQIGIINFKEEDFEKSENFFTKLYKIDPNYKKASVCDCLGDIFLTFHKKPKEALKYFNQVLEVEENELIQVKIGVCYELLEKNSEAMIHFEKAYELNKEFPAAIFHIGCIKEKRNEKDFLHWFEMAYEKEKENVEYLRKFGDMLVRSDDVQNIKKGILILEKGLEFFKGNVNIMSSLAIGYEKEKNIKEAIKLLEQANNDESFFKNKSKLFQLATYYEKQKSFSKAIEFFKNVLNLDKNNNEALLHIGYIYKSCKEYVKAYKCFNKILENDENNLHANYGIGRIFQLMKNKDEEAIEHYLKCIKIDPDFYKANIQISIVYLKLHNLDESLKYLTKIHEKDKNNALCLACIGNIYIEKKQFEEAEKYLSAALKLDKKNVATCMALADSLYGQKKYDEAINKYLLTLKLGNDIHQVHFHLGNCYYIKERYELAVNSYIDALKLVNNTRHDYYYHLGNALVAGGKIKDGIRAYQAAIKIKENKLSYYFILGRTCYLDKEYNHAIKYLEKLLTKMNSLTNEEKNKICPEKDIMFLLFKCYSSLNSIDNKKCLTIIHNLMNSEPKNIKYIECLAGFYEKINQTLDAIKTYKKILKIEPNNEEAKKNLNRLEDRDEDNYNEKKGKKH